jgi:hypothetical protein
VFSPPELALFVAVVAIAVLAVVGLVAGWISI